MKSSTADAHKDGGSNSKWATVTRLKQRVTSSAVIHPPQQGAPVEFPVTCRADVGGATSLTHPLSFPNWSVLIGRFDQAGCSSVVEFGVGGA